MQRRRVILINGAPGVGKSWVVQQLQKMNRDIVAIGLNTALIETLSVITGLDLKVPEVYARFKTTVFENGLTGRDWMIMVSEGSKEFDGYNWCKAFIRKCLALPVQRIIACDSLGFPNERDFFLASDDVDTLNVYIHDSDGSGGPVLEGPYRQFSGDSRFDLSRHCSIRAGNSDLALAMIQRSIINRGW